VVVRVGSEFFSAGEEPYRDAPAWPGPDSAPGVVGAGEGGPVRAWFVEAGTAWFRYDTLEGAEVVRAASEAFDVGFGRTATGFRVTFLVSGASEVEANETASHALRTAWAATGIEAGADDFDMCSIDVREGRRPPANDIDRPAL